MKQRKDPGNKHILDKVGSASEIPHLIQLRQVLMEPAGQRGQVPGTEGSCLSLLAALRSLRALRRLPGHAAARTAQPPEGLAHSLTLLRIAAAAPLSKVLATG